ncbi:MAG: replicative DNA helicase [Planctomycetota bacterium]|nr:replicative DNA helicase [Planctomycetota bacterium]
MDEEFSPDEDQTETITPEASLHLGARGLPYNLDAEQALLGGLILDPDQFDFIEGAINEEDFFSPAHGVVFAAMLALRKRQQPIDPVLLRNELKSAGRLDEIGGVTGLAVLTDAATSGAHVEHYAAIVQELSSLRRLIRVCSDSIRAASRPGASAIDILGEAETNIQAVTTRNFHGKILPMDEILKKTWDNMDKYLAGGEVISGLATGFAHLDELLTGLHEDELIIIAGRPAMGKSTFALNILRNVAAKTARPCVLFTLEMSAENIVRNMLAAQAKVEGQRMRNLRLSREEMEKLGAASGELNEAPIWIDETPAISLPELRGKARHLKVRHGIELIVIDYLQLMTASNLARGRSREQEVSEISRSLKALAKELHIPVIALSQLSRKPEGRQDSRPILSDLRESGAIEQDADVVLMLHRPDYYNREDHPGEAEVIIAKQRNGPTGTVNLTFINQHLRFENLAVNASYEPSGDSL